MNSTLEYFAASDSKLATELDYKVSRWFDTEDFNSGAFDDLLDEYTADYEKLVVEVSMALGARTFNDGMRHKDFPKWYEALFLAYWPLTTGLGYVALRHDDKEPLWPWFMVTACPNNSVEMDRLQAALVGPLRSFAAMAAPHVNR